ncbi:MAG: UDP-3-O-acyl-N-acetylglucosamine deacetylase [Halanaerobiales bacterium]|nr:UDP-3-O-acyl-N-acetylglucosamine deacetylase [Halanaerobiales bacterium]
MAVFNRKQNTIKKRVTIEGIGLHSGNQVKMSFNPAPPNSGIVFKRIDLKNDPTIQAVVENVTSTERSTTIGVKGVKVKTIEHLMAALSAFEIDNIVIEIDNDELPALDGSAIKYAEVLEKAGIKGQKVNKDIIKIKDNFFIKSENTYLGVFPADEFKINYLLKYEHPKIGTEYLEYTFDKNSFIKEIMPARTFGFAEEIEKLKRKGLALGGSLDNAILLKENKVVNNLRFKDEFVRHKVLDLVGDFYLNGPLVGEIIAIRTGHKDNHKMNQIIKKEINNF